MHPELVVQGFAFGDGPRWHEGYLWISDMHAAEVLKVEVQTGDVSVAASVPGSPSGLGWLPDGRLLVVSMQDRLVLRQEVDGQLAVHSDLSAIATFHCNDMVVDGAGNAYVGNFGSAHVPGTRRALADLALVRPDGSSTVAATGLGFPNGTVVTPDGRTLIIAETMGRRLSSFTIAAGGELTERAVWADLGSGLPDGICLDADGAVWYADPRARRCVRVNAGGEELCSVEMADPCYACALGGDDRQTLFVLTSPTDDPEAARRIRRGAVWSAPAPAPGVGWP